MTTIRINYTDAQAILKVSEVYNILAKNETINPAFDKLYIAEGTIIMTAENYDDLFVDVEDALAGIDYVMDVVFGDGAHFTHREIHNDTGKLGIPAEYLL